jgi:peptidoglycan/LPS O-acetylase OafA/YrhL
VVSHGIDQASLGGDTLAARLISHLDIGVTIFFLISGFLLYRPFIAHRSGGAAAPGTLDYAKRRFLRIYPAYWVALTAMVIAPDLPGVANGEWWEQYSLLQTLPVHSGVGCGSGIFACGLPQTWSLSVEVTFYAALPMYVFFAARLARNRSAESWMRAELLVLAGLSAISLLLHLFLGEPVGRSWWVGSFIGFAFWFALGMALAVLSVGFESRESQPRIVRLVASRPVAVWLAAFALYVAVALALPPTGFVVAQNQVLTSHIVFGVVAMLLIAPAVFGDGAGGAPRRLLANPVFAWLGLISYGIFLWHIPVRIYLVRYPGLSPLELLGLILGISIVIATASYYLVERPILRLKYRSIGSVLRRGRDPAGATPH